MRTLPASGDVLELRVTLLHIEPPIWRTLRLPARAPLAVVHEALQVAFGWKNCHLHDFRIGDVRIGMPDPDHADLCIDEHAAPVGAVSSARAPRGAGGVGAARVRSGEVRPGSGEQGARDAVEARGAVAQGMT